MKCCRFQKSTCLAAPQADVFAFHENPENLRLISPSSLRVKEIRAGVHAVVGETFEIVASQFGVPIRWLGRWDVVERPLRLVDVAVRAPFPVFRHEHRFDARDDGTTLMTDTVEYALPFGWLGWLAAATGGRIFLTMMFFARHHATRKYFAGVRR